MTAASGLSAADAAILFLVANAVILLLILGRNRRPPRPLSPVTAVPPADRTLQPRDILAWEFEYARITASEAMQDRHTMVNFYLIAVGVVASGVIAVLGTESTLPRATGTLLLWLLCGIGWLYFLKIIRLRQAWHDSALAMGQIKEYYLQQAQGPGPDTLREAFRWQGGSLPAPHKLWTVFFYSAMLIGYLDSFAFVVGSLLLHEGALDLRTWALFGVLWLLFFSLHVLLYLLFLKPQAEPKAEPEASP